MERGRSEFVKGLILFHMNLGFSSLPLSGRPKIIEKCYLPMVNLAETRVNPIAIEISGWSLATLKEIDPELVERMRHQIHIGNIELVGSGWAQIIGPLAPEVVNMRNQALGLEAYDKILGVTPRVALVNELAFSSGLVDLYSSAGYQAIVLDRESARAALGLEGEPAHEAPGSALGPRGNELPIIWSDTALFQRFQRVVHQEISVAEYLSVLRDRIGQGQKVLPLYTNDAEVFGHRPGRFMTEARIKGDEWQRMGDILESVQKQFDLKIVTPSSLICDSKNLESQTLTNIRYPILVKKQKKYNVNRWATSGRDDLVLNTAAQRALQQLLNSETGDEAAWRKICELWTSDFRTHLSDDRWISLAPQLDTVLPSESPELRATRVGNIEIFNTSESLGLVDGVLPVESPVAKVEIDTRRGGVLKSVAFSSHDWTPCLGTVSQGTFDAIDVAVDFYTGGVVFDLPELGRRVTDLAPCDFSLLQSLTSLRCVTESKLPLGQDFTLRTQVDVGLDQEEIVIRTEVPWQRPRGSVRVGHLTFLPGFFEEEVWIETELGGGLERFPIDRDVEHGAPVSLLVSSNNSLGGASGMVVISDATKALKVTWDLSICAAVPMLHARKVGNKRLIRLLFSLAEVDDTFREGGRLLPFELSISPG